MVRSALVRPAVLLAVVAAFGGGCSSGSPEAEAPKVATLASAAAGPAPSASAAPKVERPRERLDGTPEDWEVLIKPYEDCMARHGLSPKGLRKGTESYPGDKVFKLAEDDCQPKYYPLPPWEKDPANPESKDFMRDVVTCLKAKGVTYVELTDGGYALGGPQNDSRSISRGMELAPVCEREVAARKK